MEVQKSSRRTNGKGHRGQFKFWRWDIAEQQQPRRILDFSRPHHLLVHVNSIHAATQQAQQTAETADI